MRFPWESRRNRFADLLGLGVFLIGLTGLIALLANYFGLSRSLMYGKPSEAEARRTLVPGTEQRRQVNVPPTREPMLSGYQLSDLVRWGPILAGLFCAVGFVALSFSLGIAVGVLTAAAPTGMAVGAGVWAVVTLVLAGLIGGWVAARTSAVGGRLPAMTNAGVVWGLLVAFLLLLSAPGLLGSVIGFGMATGVAWSTFVAIILSLGGAIWGALIGMHPESEFVAR